MAQGGSRAGTLGSPAQTPETPDSDLQSRVATPWTRGDSGRTSVTQEHPPSLHWPRDNPRGPSESPFLEVRLSNPHRGPLWAVTPPRHFPSPPTVTRHHSSSGDTRLGSSVVGPRQGWYPFTGPTSPTWGPVPEWCEDRQGCGSGPEDTSLCRSQCPQRPSPASVPVPVHRRRSSRTCTEGTGRSETVHPGPFNRGLRYSSGPETPESRGLRRHRHPPRGPGV